MLPLRETKADKISTSSDHQYTSITRMNKDDDGAQQAKVDTNPDFDPQNKSAAGGGGGSSSVGPTNDPADGTNESGDLQKGASIKKRTWKKPKDKPKRPLSSYNIFFQHQRERIVEGKIGEASPEEIVQSVEAILTRPVTKRRHRKSHGRISFGDLARTIAENWKSVSPKAKSIFEHYAERDSVRYKRELKVWKDRKDLELEASTMAKHNQFINSINMSSSLRSESSSTSAYLEGLPREGDPSSMHSTSSRPPRSFSTSMNSSMTSLDSHSFHLPMGESESVQQAFHRQQQLLQRQLRMDNNLNPASTTSAGFQGINMAEQDNAGEMPRMTPGSNAFHSSFSALPSNRMMISNNSVDAVGSSNVGAAMGIVRGAAGFGALNESGMGQLGGGMDTSNTSAASAGNVALSGGAVDPLLGTTMQNRLSGMMALSSNDGRSFGGMGNMMGHGSFSGGFRQQSQQQDDLMMPNAAMMNMMRQQGQMSDIDFMQRKLEWLQEQQRRLQMQQHQPQQQQQLPSMPSGNAASVGNASNASFQLGDSIGTGSGHVVSDRSQSENTLSSSHSTLGQGSGHGFGGIAGGFSPARSYQQLQQQQQQLLQQQQRLQQQQQHLTQQTMFGGHTDAGGPMNISNSGRHPAPSSDQQSQQGPTTNDFTTNRGFGNMDMSNSSRQNH